MAIIWATDEGVNKLEELSKSIVTDLGKITAANDTLNNSVANIEDLGPHADSIKSIISAIKTRSEEANKPVKDVSKDLKDLSEKYADFISNDPFSDS